MYFTLGNIQPSLRSDIHGIQLLLVAKYTSVEEFGIDKILEPLILDLRKVVGTTQLSIHLAISTLTSGRWHYTKNWRGGLQILWYYNSCFGR